MSEVVGGDKMNPNIGYLFYKEYYEEYFQKTEEELRQYIQEKNNQIISQKYYLDSSISDDEIGKQKISLKVEYPGLLIGSGYSHGIDADDEFKIGFSFDYTSGLPSIRGSSVKGVLRSAFVHKDYIQQLIKTDKKINFNKDTHIDIEKLEDEIFGEKNSEQRKHSSRAIWKQDVFYDAVVSKTTNERTSLLGEDYITPHRNPLKDPIPLKFMKIMPNVIIDFRFNLKDGYILSIPQKLWLFRQILLDLGIGAKTNVGYGNFNDNYGKDELDEFIKYDEMEKEKKAAEEEKKIIERMTQGEKVIYYLEKVRGSNQFQNSIGELSKKLEDYSEDDQKQIARFLQTEWIKQGTWVEGEKYKKVSKKQKEKIKKVKQILSENG